MSDCGVITMFCLRSIYSINNSEIIICLSVTYKSAIWCYKNGNKSNNCCGKCISTSFEEHLKYYAPIHSCMDGCTMRHAISLANSYDKSSSITPSNEIRSRNSCFCTNLPQQIYTYFGFKFDGTMLSNRTNPVARNAFPNSFMVKLKSVVFASDRPNAHL